MKRYFNYLRNQKAQIVLPAILLVPTILLVIYLLFETAKLSRFKIRSQFALDSAAFIELTTYSNFLNAVAYVNGAFPYRVFRENLTKEVPPRDDGSAQGSQGGDPITYYDLFYQAGAFPAMGDNRNLEPKANAGRWELKFKESDSDQEDDLKEGIGRPKNWNTENPKVENILYGITSRDLVKQYKYYLINRTQQQNEGNDDEDGPTSSLILYIAVYRMFENIYENQKKVYETLTADGEFFRKSYFYNSSACKLSQCGKNGARVFKNYKLGLESAYLKKFRWWYGATNDDGKGQRIDFMPEGNAELAKFVPLYQFSYLDKTTRGKLKKMYTGVDIREPIVPPENYFRVNVKRYAKKLHVRAALQCTNESNNCVWPNPTPKYQVRLYP